MTERLSFLSATWAELNRRKVLRTVGGYAVGVFVLLQLMDAAVEPLRLPEWLPTLVVVLLILGFPLAFLLAWHLEVRADGIHRTTGEGLLSRSQSAVLFSLMLLATAGLSVVFYDYYSGVFDGSGSTVPDIGRNFSAPQNSIAVLPFADLSAGADQGHMADGIAEEILNLLAQVDGLRVAARTSSFAFRDSVDDIRKIGRVLNVRTILEGSVRTSGDRIRLTAQLINVEDGYHIWSNFYDREMDDVFEIQDEVASNIADALVESFEGLQTRPAARTDSVAAAQAYRTGRLHWWRRTPTELQKAIEMFASALEHDGRFAPAYAAMADSWLLLSLYGNVTKVKAIEKAQAMIDKALAIDPESAEAFGALGLARWQIGQLDAAESALRHAMDLNEDYIPAQLWLAGVLGEQGRFPEEHLVLKNAMNRDPLNELLLVNHAGNLSIRGEWAGGKEVIREVLDLHPDSTMLLRTLAKLELWNGNLVEGWKWARKAYDLEPNNPEEIAALARTWVMLGDPERADGLIREGLKTSGQNANLLNAHWMTLVVARRYEEAEALVKETKKQSGADLPPTLERQFNFQLGMIALIQKQYPRAHRLLLAAINEEDQMAYSGNDVWVLTLAALAAERVGEPEQAAELVDNAERRMRRGRLNGVDDHGIVFNEAVLLAMRNEPARALVKLQESYDKGFRDAWALEIDSRLGPLRGSPEFIALKHRIEDDLAAARLEIDSLLLAVL